ncbi:phage protease [Grimontia sp. NTOU-MAR1]|uniref:phage protease n=1 Tax=Grimontia sp. NTOU-MAR1 TaxID=3111011 RepID=UPI002DB6D77D|nr:phage protease [Grimontia sp. NTOU-MAR1]WRV98567.1 phage protease [Grimontia sp. NTOU-MAR1]
MPDTPQTRHLALCFQLPPQQADARERWLELIPAGTFSGIDGRSWSNSSPDDVVLNSAASAPWDIEHATHIKGPLGEEAPAYGWVEEYDVRDGAIWGRVAFNREGVDIITERKYRYYSPAFLHDAQGNVTAIESVGFTNKPNLTELPALNRQQQEQETMTLPVTLATALALDTATATEADALSAIETLKSDKQLALNRADNPDLKKYVPMETHQLALNRAEAAEGQLKAQQDAETEAVIDEAIAEGKIAPANKAAFLSMCRTDREGFDRFLASAPKVVSDESRHTQPPKNKTNLDEHELAICRKLHITQEQYLAAKTHTQE